MGAALQGGEACECRSATLNVRFSPLCWSLGCGGPRMRCRDCVREGYGAKKCRGGVKEIGTVGIVVVMMCLVG